MLKKQAQQTETISFLKGATEFTSPEWKRFETKVTEEYCLAITQAAGLSCCGRSHSSFTHFGFQLNRPVQTHAHTHTNIYIYIYHRTVYSIPNSTRFHLRPTVPKSGTVPVVGYSKLPCCYEIQIFITVFIKISN
jgi:hypothetical protein